MGMVSRRRGALLAGAALVSVLVGVSGAALAADADAAASVSNPSSMDEVLVLGDRGYQSRVSSVATRTDAPLIEVPQAVSVVGAAQIRDWQPMSLDEALQSVAGARQGNTLGGTQDAIMLRGFGTNRNNSIMRDGMQSVQARNFTPNTEMVEVLKGPASMLYSVQDPGGVINVVTKKPQLVSAGSLTGWGTSFGGGGGQVDLTGRVPGTDGDAGTGLAYRMIADYQQYAYWRNFGSTSQRDFAPSLAWYGQDTTVSLSYERMDYVVPFDRGTQIDTRTGKVLNIPRERRLDEPFNKTKGHSDAVALRVEHRFNEDWKARFNYGFNDEHYNDRQERALSVNAVTGFITRRGDATRDANQIAHLASADLQGRVDVAGMTHELLVGVDYMRNDQVLGDLMRGAQNSTFNIYHPVYGTQPLPTTVSQPNSRQTDKLHTYAGFIQDSIHLDDQWILLAGIRYDQAWELTGKGRPFNANANQSDGKAVPRVGLVYLPRPDVSIYASYSQSFRPNTSVSTPIGALPPEQGEAFEVGSKYVGDALTVTAALFDIKKNNVQTSLTVNGETVTRVTGQAESRGLELEATGSLAPGWDVSANYAYTDARTTSDPILRGNPLDGVSRHAGAIFLNHDLGTVAGGQVRAGAGERAYSDWGAGDGTGKVYYMPGAAVTDVYIRYATHYADMPLDLQLTVKNLFDETYYTSSSGGGTPSISLGTPREFMVRTTLSF